MGSIPFDQGITGGGVDGGGGSDSFDPEGLVHMPAKHQRLRPISIPEMAEEWPMTDVITFACSVTAPIGWRMADVDERDRRNAELIFEVLGQLFFG